MQAGLHCALHVLLRFRGDELNGNLLSVTLPLPDLKHPNQAGCSNLKVISILASSSADNEPTAEARFSKLKMSKLGKSHLHIILRAKWDRLFPISRKEF